MNIVERKITIDSWAVKAGALKGTRRRMTEAAGMLKVETK
jgi:hypothetical protein